MPNLALDGRHILACIAARQSVVLPCLLPLLREAPGLWDAWLDPQRAPLSTFSSGTPQPIALSGPRFVGASLPCPQPRAPCAPCRPGVAHSQPGHCRLGKPRASRLTSGRCTAPPASASPPSRSRCAAALTPPLRPLSHLRLHPHDGGQHEYRCCVRKRTVVMQIRTERWTARCLVLDGRPVPPRVATHAAPAALQVAHILLLAPLPRRSPTSCCRQSRRACCRSCAGASRRARRWRRWRRSTASAPVAGAGRALVCIHCYAPNATLPALLYLLLDSRGASAHSACSAAQHGSIPSLPRHICLCYKGCTHFCRCG